MDSGSSSRSASTLVHEPRRASLPQRDPAAQDAGGPGHHRTPAPPAQLSLKHRMLAATGASVLSAVVVNPLDVVKVRMQAQAASAAPAARSYHAYCFSIPVRSIQNSSRKFLLGAAAPSTLSQHPVLQEMIASCLGKGASRAAAMGAAQQQGTHCLCATAAGVGALHFPTEGGYVRATGGGAQPLQLPWPGLTTSLGRGSAGGAVAGSGMLETLRTIVRQEGAPSLWRGLDSALLMSVPTVLLYYPLYDHLMHLLTQPTSATAGAAGTATAPAHTQQQQQQHKQAWSWSLGAAAPVVAGASARTVTVMAVAPLEYIRTLQQAGVSVGTQGTTANASTSALAASQGPAGATARVSIWQAVRMSLGLGEASAAAAVGAGGAAAGGAGVWGVVRALPRLWTGLSATIARDVPFSAVYWGLVEPIRGSILSSSSSLARLTSTSTSAAPNADSAATATTTADLHSLPGRALTATPEDRSSSSSSSGASKWPSTPRQEQDDWVAAADSPSASAATFSRLAGSEAVSCSSSGGDSSGATAVVVAGGAPSHTQLVLANVLAGSLAGATASALTTPFDVVKTRMQIASPGNPGSGGSMLGVMRQVVRQQGVRGLFVGVGPRAARCAPACAIVLFSYELLKRTLADQQQQ